MFKATGALANDGGALGQWSERPQGCSRDPWDGKPLAESSQIASFFWEDSYADGPDKEKMSRKEAPDAPLRLDLYRAGGAVAGRLQTVDRPGLRLDATICREIAADTREQAPVYAGGRPTLRGTVRLDCRVQGSHLTAQIEFRYCEF